MQPIRSMKLMNHWRPRVGWGVPLAWVTLCIVWSSTWLAIKIVLRDLPPISFVAIRFLIAIIVLLAVSIGRTRLLPLRRNDYAVLAITGVLMFAVNYTLLFWGELHVSSGLAAVLQATIPIFGMIFAHWMLPDEPLRLQKLAGAIIALGGVTVICGWLLGFNGPAYFLGGRGRRCWSCQRCLRQRARQGPVHAACSRNVGRMADEFRNRTFVGAWPPRRRKAGVFSLDCHVCVLPSTSGCHRVSIDVSASLLATAAPDSCAVAKHFAYHSAPEPSC